MKIAIDRGRSEALHWQIAESLRSQILDGDLKPGQRLTPVRQLAEQLGVHRLTVFKAYEELVAAKLLETKPGGGTFVASEFSRKAAIDLLGRLVDTGPINRFEAVSEEAGIRSLATNVPDPWLFRADEFLLECYELRKASPWVFYYAPPAGAHELCSAVAEHLTSRGLPTVGSQIVITSGNTHSMTLSLDLSAAPGSCVAIEDPTFLAAESWLSQRGYRCVPIQTSADGLDLEALRHAVQAHGCQVLAIAPYFGQVTGNRMPEEKQEELARTCAELGCVVLELGATSLVSYGQPAKPLSSRCDPGATIYVDDFSSALSPGLRIGFLRVSLEHARRLEKRLQAEHYSGVQFIQIALANFISRGLLKAHLDRVIPRYRSRRDRLISSLRAHLPTEASWTHPEGGFSTWLQLPEGPNYESLYARCLERGVAIAPGRLFTERPDKHRFARLSFGTQEPPAIEEAIRTLGEVVKEFQEGVYNQ